MEKYHEMCSAGFCIVLHDIKLLHDPYQMRQNQDSVQKHSQNTHSAEFQVNEPASSQVWQSTRSLQRLRMPGRLFRFSIKPGTPFHQNYQTLAGPSLKWAVGGG